MAKKTWRQMSRNEKMAMAQYVIDSPPHTPLSAEHAASYLGISTATLQKMRCEDTNGILFTKIGRQIVYYKKDLESYLNSMPAYQHTAQYT
ncbi:helix-turn-helix domain-containing protein [Psychrobacter faecalis]|uniref:helix-turn-helix domain-containing protein n=1 Tax=Psychrobacter faecalis TaxID=180588 RepID=UPI003FD36253